MGPPPLLAGMRGAQPGMRNGWWPRCLSLLRPGPPPDRPYGVPGGAHAVDDLERRHQLRPAELAIALANRREGRL